MTDIRRSLHEEVDRVRPPELWGAIEARATAPERPATMRRAPRALRPRSRLAAALLALVLFAGVAVALWSVARQTPAPIGTTCGVWERTGPKRPGSMYDVDALGPRDVWAVGDEVRGGVGSALLLHGDGRSWKTVAYPADAGLFAGVAALSDTDVWVVGEKLLHFDGTRWLVFEPPRPAGAQYVFGFNDVIALAHDDVWAVGGFDFGDGHPHAFVAHWNGAAWSVVDTPESWTAFSSVGFGIAARSPEDVWVVGQRSVDPGPQHVTNRLLAMHWNGSRWQLVAPSTRGLGALYDVAVFGDTGAWAVGEGGRGALVEHFDGSRWHAVHNPATPTRFQGIAMVSNADVWVAGRDAVQHWNGDEARWTSTVPVPGAELMGVEAAGGHEWAFGISPDYQTLIVHRC